MKNKKNITKLIFEIIDDINQQLPRKHNLKKSLDTSLFGPTGNLDSLGIVNLIVAVEQKIREVFGVRITLANERAMSQNDSPFETIGTLVDYIYSLLQEDCNA